MRLHRARTHVIAVANQHNLKELKHYVNLSTNYTSKDEIVTKFSDNIKSNIRQKAAKGKSKYITYLQINPNLETPSVYCEVMNRKQVAMLATLRVSSAHNLQIEMGRRTRIDPHLRVCHCKEDVENELHFLLRCSVYQDIRLSYGVNGEINLDDLLNDKKYVLYIEELWKRRKIVRE